MRQTMFKIKIIKALQDRYESQISEAEATIEIYLTKPVGIGEHPQHIDEVDKLVGKINMKIKITGVHKGKIELLKSFFCPLTLSR